MMTWHTESGPRILKGAGADLIRESLSYMVDRCEEEIEGLADPKRYHVSLFDSLEPPIRFALLAEVGFALLRETDTCPELNAINESVVAALIRNIEGCLLFEIDHHAEETCIDASIVELQSFWRTRILAVFEETGEADELPGPECTDWGEWSILIEVLHDRILWDEDYELSHLFLDSPPEHADHLRSVMSIKDDYYRAIPPDPTDADLRRIRAVLQGLC